MTFLFGLLINLELINKNKISLKKTIKLKNLTKKTKDLKKQELKNKLKILLMNLKIWKSNYQKKTLMRIKMITYKMIRRMILTKEKKWKKKISNNKDKVKSKDSKEKVMIYNKWTLKIEDKVNLKLQQSMVKAIIQ